MMTILLVIFAVIMIGIIALNIWQSDRRDMRDKERMEKITEKALKFSNRIKRGDKRR